MKEWYKWWFCVAAVLAVLRRHRGQLAVDDDLDRLARDVVLIGHALVDDADRAEGLEDRVMRALLGYLSPNDGR